MDSRGQIFDGDKETLPKDSFPILKEEHMLLNNVPQEHRLRTLINLRFKAWLEYNKLKPDMITKMKMKQAFEAGFMAREVKD